MSRRLKTIVIAVPLLLLLLLAAGFAVFALRGADAPAAPALSTAPSTTPEPSPGDSRPVTWRPSGEDGYVGYRVREEFVGVGVVDAVGRTNEVTGTVETAGSRITAADLEADLTSLRSDEERRDRALSDRGLEWETYPTASFELSEPVRVSREPVRAAGRLTLHGQTREVTVRVAGQRDGAALELVGSVPVDFARFGIEPPSIAGFVTVEDEGTMEFRLVLRQA